MSKKHVVAVYGSLREGFGNHGFLDTAKLLGTTKTQPEYKMFSLGAYPAVCTGGDTPITLEVYEVDGDTFESLDRLEGHPEFYCRRQVHTEFGKAWMYMIESMRTDTSSTRVMTGDWSDRSLDTRPF